MWLLLLSSLALANDVVTLNEGDPAPFTGTLLSPEAAAKIIVDSDSSVARCRIEAERNLALREAELNLQFTNKEAELAACMLRSTEMANLYEQQIDFLEKQTVRPSWEGPALFVGGILTGVAVFYGSAAIVKNLQ